MDGNTGFRRVNWHDEQTIRQLVSDSTSQSDVLRKLGLTPASNAVTLRKYIAKYSLDTSHFDTVPPKTRNGSTAVSLDDILVQNSTRVDRKHLKKRLVSEGILAYQCAVCLNDGIWEGQPLSLQLEHKNGIRTDNRRENLEFLCPNCHSQTSTYAGKNKNI